MLGIFAIPEESNHKTREAYSSYQQCIAQNTIQMQSTGVRKQQYCGNSLKRVLKLLCNDRLHSGTPHNETRLHGTGNADRLDAHFDRKFGFNSTNIGSRHGVVGECCQRPCSIAVLRKYCREN